MPYGHIPCSACGHMVHPGGISCPECGQKIDGHTTDPRHNQHLSNHLDEQARQTRERHQQEMDAQHERELEWERQESSDNLLATLRARESLAEQEKERNRQANRSPKGCTVFTLIVSIVWAIIVILLTRHGC